MRGERPERWIAQTQFANDEVGYPPTGSNRLGVEDELNARCRTGAPVTIGDMTFDWGADHTDGGEVPVTGRGTDIRPDRSGARRRGRTQAGTRVPRAVC